MTSPADAPAAGAGDEQGYRHPQYAQAFSEFGTPVFLPRCGGWIVRRPVPGSGLSDATGCYPVFVCDRWDALAEDLRAIAGDLVSVTLVTDPFAGAELGDLRRAFDTVIPFKEHFVLDLARRPAQPRSRHHPRYADRALRAVEIELCADPLAWLDDWVALFDLLVRKHRLRGMRAFSRESFRHQLTVPGIVMFRASRQGVTVGLHLWYLQGRIGYAHLGATSEEGRALMASYALYAAAIEWFETRADWLSLGGAAGTRTGDSPDDGLAYFKKGWATGSRPVYVCGRILDAAEYARLAAAAPAHAGAYFPAYRRGEFD